MDYGSRIADKTAEKTARELKKVYAQAAEELKAKIADFARKHAVKQKEMLAKLEKGEITQAAYQSWMRGQVFIGKQWEQKVDQAVKIIEDANKEAALLVKANKLNVFAENYNHAAYELEKRLNGVISFNLFNDRAVARLMKKRPKMLPEWKVNEKKDYRWNRQKVENAITQGIIQGEGIEKITDRMVTGLCTANRSKMTTFSRTAITGAQNAGRLAQMEDAEDEGIKVKKRWVATLDNRTRDLHADLDGQEVPVDEPFKIDGYEIDYPGDPSAAPEMVYNCRCTMIEVFEGITRKSVRRAYEDSEDGHRKSYTVEDMTYNEWKAWKEGRR